MPVSLNSLLSTGSLIADQAEMLQKVDVAFLREFENLLRLHGQLSQSEDDARMTSADVAGRVQIVSAKQTPDDFSDSRQHSRHKTAIVGSPPPGCESPPTSPTSTSGGSGIGGDLYKTELCRAFEERGQCRYGEKCQFAHGVADLRSLDRHPKYKTELCRTYHSTGFCPYGARCHFVHNEPLLVRLPTPGPAPEAIALTPAVRSPPAFASVSPTFGQPLSCGVPMAAAAAATPVPNGVQPLPLMKSGQSTTAAASAAVGTRYSENLRQLNTLAAALDAALKATCNPLTASSVPPPPPPGLGQFPVSMTLSQPSGGPNGLQQKCNATANAGSVLLQHRRRPNMETTLTVGLLNDVIIPDVSMTHLNQPRQQHFQQHQVPQPRQAWAGIAASTVGGSRSPAVHRLSTATADSGYGSARNSVCSPTVFLSSPDDVIVSPTAPQSALYDAAAAGVYSLESVPCTSAARVGTALRLQQSDTNGSLCGGRLTPRAFADWPLSPVGACRYMMASCHKSQ